MDGIVFDKQAINSLKHNINHLRRCFQYIPKPIKTMKWECDIFKNEQSLETALNSTTKRLEVILGIIELAEGLSNV